MLHDLFISAGADNINRKYQFMEANQQRRAAGLKDKMPDIQKTLDTVRFLKTRKVLKIYALCPYQSAD